MIGFDKISSSDETSRGKERNLFRWNVFVVSRQADNTLKFNSMGLDPCRILSNDNDFCFRESLTFSGSDQAREGRLVDALAVRGDEGRDTLR